MKSVKVLLGNYDRRINNLVEALVLDVCYDQRSVEFTRMCRANEFFRQGRYAGFDLIVVAPDNLLPEPGRRGDSVALEEVAGAIRTFKSQHSTPIVAIAVSDKDKLPLLEAGADGVMGLPFNCDALKSEVSRALRLPEQVSPAESSKWSLAASFLRGFRRLKNA